jgi:hypothetical protein
LKSEYIYLNQDLKETFKKNLGFFDKI